MTVIKVENVSKRYRLGVQEKADTFAGQLKNAITYPIRNFKRITQLKKFDDENDPSVFWALKDINFEVKQGEVLGIIGRNGAGKSTLLKVLSKITEPTTGSIKIKGRVSSLLEVGTGFHPELTGRDNVYMNGTILGMTKKEIDNKFDEIVDFSGVEQHIDTPVKFYSSGMKVRLGFSVAAHLETEILIIDEVLAVGDFEFQKRCLGKMDDVAKSGRTVIFVSHNMDAIQKLCTRAISLKNGVIDSIGTVESTIEKYLASAETTKKTLNISGIKRESGYGELIKITGIDLLNSKNVATNNILFREKFEVKVYIKSFKHLKDIDVSVRIDSDRGVPITSIVSSDSDIASDFNKYQEKVYSLKLDYFYLTPGNYSLVVTVKSGRMAYDRLENIINFKVSNLVFGNQKPHNELWGLVQLYPKWEIKSV